MTVRTLLKAGAADRVRLHSADTRAQRAIKSGFASIRDSLNSAEIIGQLKFGNYEGAIDAIVTPFYALGDILSHVYLDSARTFTDTVTESIGTHVPFNPVGTRVVNDMRNLRAAIVRDLNSTMRDAMRSVLLGGLQENVTVEELARRMLDTVGLTARDVTAIENYQRAAALGHPAALTTSLRDRRYDAAVRRADVAPQALARMVAAKRRLTKTTTLNRMAQTQANRAINAGRFGLLNQLADNDVIAVDNVQRTWQATGDLKTRDSHAGINGETRVGLEELFSNGLLYPGDPDGPAAEVINCRCSLAFDIQPN